MCLIGIAWQSHPRYAFIMAANRDEFYARPTAAAHWWRGHRTLAGLDLEGNGTWLGATRDGRFAALTNFRERLHPHPEDPRPSRGQLVRRCLEDSADGHLPQDLRARAEDFAGFNLLSGRLVGPRARLSFHTNRGSSRPTLEPGVYGMSNGELGADWPKVIALKATMDDLPADLPPAPLLLSALTRAEIASDTALPDTGVGIELERRLSAAFILSEGYGTRCSTVLLVDYHGNATFIVRTFDSTGAAIATREFLWRIDQNAEHTA
jgi:uncharacterized protein with NRDE domain